jgi:hypothetical protein
MRRSRVRFSEAAPGVIPSQRRLSAKAPPSSSGPSSGRAPVVPRAAEPRLTNCGRSCTRTGPSSWQLWRAPVLGLLSDQRQKPATPKPPCGAHRNAQLGPPNRRLRLTPADRPLPVRFPQRPPAGAAKSHSAGLLPALHRSTMSTTTGTSGTVRALLFFNVSTYNSPPPLLARTARDNRSPGPGTLTRSPTCRPASSPHRRPCIAST